MARNGLARRIELEQLLGHVAHGLLDLGLRPLPRRAAETIDGRLGRAGVFLNEVEPLDRHEQLVLARVAKLEELLFVVADANLLQPDEDADAVIDMDDVVVDLEIAKIRKEGLRRGPALRRATLLVEDIGVRVDLETGVRQAESLRDASLRDQHGRVARVFRALDRHREDLVLLQQLNGSLRATGRRGRKQRRAARLAMLADVGDPVSQPPVERDRRLAAYMRLIIETQLRQRRRLRQPRVDIGPLDKEVRRRRDLRLRRRIGLADRVVTSLQLFQQLRRLGVDFVPLGDDDVRVAREREIVEERGAAIVAEDVLQRNHDKPIHGRRRSLRRRIVGPHRLDGVAGELQPDRQRFTGGKDVDDAAADGELAVFIDRIFTREPGIDQQFGQIGGVDVLPGPQID